MKIDTIIREDIEEIEKTLEPQVPEPEDSKLTNNFILGVGILIVLLAAFFGVSYYYNNNRPPPELPQIEYNGFDFVYFDDLWNFEWQRGNNLYNMHFYYNPEEALEIPVTTINPLSDVFQLETIYTTFDPLANNTLYFPIAQAELVLTIVRVFERFVVAGCSQNATLPCASQPIVTCETTQAPVILLHQDPEAKITIDDDCVILQGTDKELIKAVDRFLYGVLGII